MVVEPGKRWASMACEQMVFTSFWKSHTSGNRHSCYKDAARPHKDIHSQLKPLKLYRLLLFHFLKQQAAALWLMRTLPSLCSNPPHQYEARQSWRFGCIVYDSLLPLPLVSKKCWYWELKHSIRFIPAGISCTCDSFCIDAVELSRSLTSLRMIESACCWSSRCYPKNTIWKKVLNILRANSHTFISFVGTSAFSMLPQG